MYQVIVRFNTSDEAAIKSIIPNRTGGKVALADNIRIYHVVPSASRDVNDFDYRDNLQYKDVRSMDQANLAATLCERSGVDAVGVMFGDHGIAILGRSDTTVAHLNWEERNLFTSDPAFTLFLGDEE